MAKAMCTPEESFEGQDLWGGQSTPASAPGFSTPFWAPYGNTAFSQDLSSGQPQVCTSGSGLDAQNAPNGTPFAPPWLNLPLFGDFPQEQVCRPPTTADYGNGLDQSLDAQIKGNRSERAKLDALRNNKDPGAKDAAGKLDGDRQNLLDKLNQRSQTYGGAIDEINAQLGNKTPKNPTAEEKKLLEQRARLEQEKGKYADQHTALQRWHDRGEINQINEKLKDPNLSADKKAELLANKKKLATGLLSTVKTYQQFDPRWGNTVYGKDKSYTSMTEAGCGPTGLADLMDFADQEDPEGHHAAGEKDPFSPRKMADYATNHGRVKNNGTAGTTMMNDLSKSFSGFAGQDIHDQKGAVESLNNGVPVLFLGHDITGIGGNGKNTKPYGGHFMVLNGVSDDGKTFGVADGGRNSARNIQKITSKQLSGHTAGYWNVQHQP